MSELSKALEQAAAKYAEKLRSDSSTRNEQLPPKEKVAGSSPAQITNTKKTRK
jgi:hypothetical protein